MQWLERERAENPGHSDSLYLYEVADVSFVEPGFIDRIKELFEQNEDVCRQICIGVSEKKLMKSTRVMRGFIADIKALGARVALTDVGNAMVPTRLLKEIKVDFLMIDPVLMQELETDESAYITVKYINDLIHLSGVKSIVDVGNDESKLEALKTLKIDYVKGSFAQLQEQQIC